MSSLSALNAMPRMPTVISCSGNRRRISSTTKAGSPSFTCMAAWPNPN